MVLESFPTLITSAFIACLLCAGGVPAAEPPGTRPADQRGSVLAADEQAAGFKSLFDGISTDAWRTWDGDGFPKKGWVVEDGCLKCAGTNGRPNGGGGDLVSREEWGDFEFRWEWRISAAGNSGVKYMLRRGNAGSPLYAGDKGKDVYGHEYQMLDDDKHPDAKRGPTHMTAAFYDVIPPNEAKKVRPAGEFNESRIVVRGDHVEHWLNGVKVVEYELGSDAVRAAVAKSKYKALPGFGTKSKTGLLLQDHGNEVWFRNMRVRDLAAESKPK